MDEPKFGRMFKVLVVGDSQAGKTTFLMRYCDNTFTSRYVPTVGVDFKVKNLDRLAGCCVQVCRIFTLGGRSRSSVWLGISQRRSDTRASIRLIASAITLSVGG